MNPDITALEAHLASNNHEVRLKALKLILVHPQATPLQIVRCLCSNDIPDFGFWNVFELDKAMRGSWPRLRGVEDPNVYAYLSDLYRSDPTRKLGVVIHILECLSTRKALEMLQQFRKDAPIEAQQQIEDACKIVSHQIPSD